MPEIRKEVDITVLQILILKKLFTLDHKMSFKNSDKSLFIIKYSSRSYHEDLTCSWHCAIFWFKMKSVINLAVNLGIK